MTAILAWIAFVLTVGLSFPRGDVRVLGALAQIVLLGLAGWTSLELGRVRTFNLFTAAIALRILVIYFEVFGSMLSTGVGMITGGVLTLVLAWLWKRQSSALTSRLAGGEGAMRRRFRLALALALPLVVIAIGIVRGELHLAGARRWTFEVGGYDPRDLLQGRYLAYRLELHEEAPLEDVRGNQMKFGLFFEHQVPRPWEATSEHTVLRQALEQVEYAESLGIDYVWVVEHHFLEEYSHSSAPELFLAAALAAHPAHASRARHRADAAAVQPPGARRRAHRHARPAVERSRRFRHRRVVVRGGARRIPDRSRREARPCGRKACGSRCAA